MVGHGRIVAGRRRLVATGGKLLAARAGQGSLAAGGSPVGLTVAMRLSDPRQLNGGGAGISTWGRCHGCNQMNQR